MNTQTQFTPKMGREGQIHAFVADADSDTLEQALQFCQKFPSMRLVGSSQTAQETLDALRLEQVDLLVLSIELGGKIIGLELIPSLRQLQPRLRILAVSGKDGRHQKSSLVSGAHGFLLKPFHHGELVAAVATVLDGKLYYDAGLLEHFVGTSEVRSGETGLELPETLTDEDRTYIHARLSGKSDAQIAQDLSVKMVTITQRRHRITKRLGLETDLETFLLRASQWQSSLGERAFTS